MTPHCQFSETKKHFMSIRCYSCSLPDYNELYVHLNHTNIISRKSVSKIKYPGIILDGTNTWNITGALL